jgi:hypothetical protein
MMSQVIVMVSQRRGRDIFVVSNPMPHKLRQERNMPLRIEIWLCSMLQRYRAYGAGREQPRYLPDVLQQRI